MTDRTKLLIHLRILKLPEGVSVCLYVCLCVWVCVCVSVCVFVSALTLGLMTIALISGISKLDLRTETTEMSVCPLRDLQDCVCVCVRGLSLVAGSLCPHGFDILRTHKVKYESVHSEASLRCASCDQSLVTLCSLSDHHLLDELAPAPGADLSVSCTQEVTVGGEQTEDGTFVSCGEIHQFKLRIMRTSVFTPFIIATFKKAEALTLVFTNRLGLMNIYTHKQQLKLLVS